MVEEDKTKKTEEKTETPKTSSKPTNATIDTLDAIRQERKKLEQVLEETRAEGDRIEALHGQAALGGDSDAGQETEKPEFTEEELASRKRIKAVGEAGGAEWAKKM